MTTTISQRELRNDVVPHEVLPVGSRYMTMDEIQEVFRGLPPVDTDAWWSEILDARRAEPDARGE